MGDFNIHVCCESNSLAKDFTNLMDSFDFIQMINSPTHKQSHTFYLVLLHGISIRDLEILDLSFSDHMPVIFTCSFPNGVSKTMRLSQQIRTFTSSSSDDFTVLFKEACQSYSLDSLSNLSNVDEHLMLFNSISSDIINSVAPLREKRKNSKAEPWVTSTTLELRRVCRRAERKWKKDKLQVSYEILRESLIRYQKSVKAAKSQYFSDIIAKNSYKPKMLFTILNSVVSPVSAVCLNASASVCDSLLKFFTGKIVDIRQNIVSSNYDSSVPSLCVSPFKEFQTVSFNLLKDIIKQLKPTICLHNVFPTHFLLQVFDDVGPSILAIIYKSLLTGVVPKYLKHATFKPFFKQRLKGCMF